MEKPDWIQLHKQKQFQWTPEPDFVEICEHVWNTHVVPLLKDHHDNNMRAEGAVMRSEELEFENKALQEKLKIADHLKELDDDAIVTLQKENKQLSDSLKASERFRAEDAASHMMEANDLRDRLKLEQEANKLLHQAMCSAESRGVQKGREESREEIERLKAMIPNSPVEK